MIALDSDVGIVLTHFNTAKVPCGISHSPQWEILLLLSYIFPANCKLNRDILSCAHVLF